MQIEYPLQKPIQNKQHILPVILSVTISILFFHLCYAGFLLLGSSGEGVLMTSQEKLELVKQSRQVIGEGKILIAGAGAESGCFF